MKANFFHLIFAGIAAVALLCPGCRINAAHTPGAGFKANPQPLPEQAIKTL